MVARLFILNQLKNEKKEFMGFNVFYRSCLILPYILIMWR